MGICRRGGERRGKEIKIKPEGGGQTRGSYGFDGVVIVAEGLFP